MNTVKGLRRLSIAIATAMAIALPTAIPAHAAGSDAGLYGASDPTYDGVYRQSLALLGLAANDITPPTSAIAWLLDQQCADGSFQAYRADTGQPCAKADPANFTGPDTNSTALALMALMALDDSRVMNLKAPIMNRIVDSAESAGTWLRKQQNADGGWPYYAGGASDANSTGLSLAAANTWGGTFGSKLYKKASRFLGRLSSSCADGGGFAYQSGSKPDGSATSQGVVGLAGSLPVSKQPTAAVAAPCANTAKAKGISYLAKGLSSTGLLPSSLGGIDYSSTAMAVLGLTEARQGRASIRKATAALKASADEFVTGNGTNPGAAGLLLMVAEATGSKPTAFGGVNLVSTLASSIRG